MDSEEIEGRKAAFEYIEKSRDLAEAKKDIAFTLILGLLTGIVVNFFVVGFVEFLKYQKKSFF